MNARGRGADTISGSSSRQACLMLVEHDDDSREMYRQFLEEQDLRVIAVVDAAMALRIARIHRPDLIVTELALPDMDGIALCCAMGKLFGRRVPVVTVTGFTNPAHLASAKIAGAVRVLTKPCPPDVLYQSVETLLATWPMAYRQSMELHRLVRSRLRRPGDAQPSRVPAPEEHAAQVDGHQLVGTVVASDSGLILDADAGAASLTGYRASELIGNSIWRLCPPESREEYRTIWRGSRAAGGLRGSIGVVDVGGDLRAFQFEAGPEKALGTHLCAFMPEPSAMPVHLC